MKLDEALKLSTINLQYDNKHIIHSIINNHDEVGKITKNEFLTIYRRGKTVISSYIDSIIKAALGFVTDDLQLSDLDIIERQERQFRAKKGDMIKGFELISDVTEGKDKDGKYTCSIEGQCMKCKDIRRFSYNYMISRNFHGCKNCGTQNKIDYSVGKVFGVLKLLSEPKHDGYYQLITGRSQKKYTVKTQCIRCGNISEKAKSTLRRSRNSKSCEKCYR